MCYNFAMFNLFKKNQIELAPTFDFEVVGMNNYIKAIERIGTIDPLYNLPDAELIELGRSKVYKYTWDIKTVKLAPEPFNKYDKNAVKVVVNGAHIGYIPNEYNALVLEYIRRPCDVTLTIRGGTWRERLGDRYIEKSYTYYADGKITLK